MSLNDIIQDLVSKHNYSQLLDIQDKFLQEYDEDSHQNLIVCAPTTRGKTLVAEAMINFIVQTKENPLILYIAPLIILIDEKKSDLENILSSKIKIITFLDDYDQLRPNLLLATPEKLFVLLKDSPDIILSAELIIIDEVHLLSDKSRGPVLNISLTFLNLYAEYSVFLLMSATLSYHKELAKWNNNAVTIISGERAVDLTEHVIPHAKNKKVPKLINLIKKERRLSKIVLVFCGTKPWCHSRAKKLWETGYSDLIVNSTITELEKSISTYSKADQEVINLLIEGIAIYHANVDSGLKTKIYDLIKNKKIGVIFSTTSFGLGVNLPVDVVIVADTRLGKDPLPPMVYKQLAGRAGRLGSSSGIGESYILVLDHTERYWKKITEEPAISDPPTSIIDKNEGKILIELLRLVNTGFFDSWEDVGKLVDQLFGQARKRVRPPPESGTVKARGLTRKLRKSYRQDKIIELGEWLESDNLVVMEEDILSLSLRGALILDLEIDPKSIREVFDSLNSKKIEDNPEQIICDIILNIEEQLYIVPFTRHKNTADLVIKSISDLSFRLLTIEEELADKSLTGIHFASAALSLWINEVRTLDIANKLDVWHDSIKSVRFKFIKLLEIFQLMAEEENDFRLLKELTRLRWRVKNGVRDNLLPLVKIHGIGGETAKKMRIPFEDFISSGDLAKFKEEIKHIPLVKNKIDFVCERLLINLDPVQQEQVNEKITDNLKTLVQGFIDNSKGDDESRTFDFKDHYDLTSSKGKRTFVHHMIAFANAAGGFLIFGISDNRDIVGINTKNFSTTKLTSIIQNNIESSFDGYDFNLIEFKDKKIVLVIKISAVDSTPIRVRPKSQIPYRKPGRINMLQSTKEWYKLRKQRNQRMN